ncbi:hypothetical protein GN244_ATG01529 [Phytophthora infestans]|uniref:Secreted RxLR effector peptide protein n=1 Tax=Phytophthora infestans TaxID=4787 RepID=A0A833X1Y3_PHYIN|nr:hypothetical protein GN244_ATG01529 [Phytophthora infestans]
MHFYHVVLLTLLAVAAISIDALASAEVSKLAAIKITPTIRYNDGKLLRRLNLGYNDLDTEDRDISSLIRRAQVYYWTKMGKSKDYVKEALGLKGTELKKNPKYKYYEEFKINSRRPMAVDNLETRQQLMNNAEYRMYLRYATEFDDQYFQRVKKSDKLTNITPSPSPAEMEARIRIWVKAKRPNWYVEKLLGVENNSQFKELSREYQLFLKLQEAKK